jgi:hypothetical protein
MGIDKVHHNDVGTEFLHLVNHLDASGAFPAPVTQRVGNDGSGWRVHWSVLSDLMGVLLEL